jgi:hypothetical protein
MDGNRTLRNGTGWDQGSVEWDRMGPVQYGAGYRKDRDTTGRDMARCDRTGQNGTKTLRDGMVCDHRTYREGIGWNLDRMRLILTFINKQE